MAFLELNAVTKDFGGLRANDHVSFSLEQGELVGLIGPNGAGKTTLFNCISGLHPITSGRIFFDGEEITTMKTYDVARRGMARTFQVYVASGDLTVEENVMVGCFMHTRSRIKAREKARDILKGLKLQTLSESRVKELPVAAQKRVIMATALGTKPKLLLLDEVAAGLNPSEIEEIMTSIRHVHDNLGVTVMLIEHVMELVMKVSARVIVLDYGKLIADGSPEQVSRDRRVIKAYLGERFAAELAPETQEERTRINTDEHG
ncbi:MAG: ABC transporter ATP-binding protein [Desulfobacterales bacterium]|nr:ABC transporter ATP-binding protein [Desulfobacterales bacterium]